MALDGVLARIPGLGGYLAQEQFDQRRALGDLSGVVTLAQAAEQARMAPLKQQMLQAQMAEMQRKAAEEQRAQTMLGDIVRQFGPRTETVRGADDEMTGTPGAVTQVQRPADLLGMGTAMLNVPGREGMGANLIATAEAAQGRRDAQMQAAQARMAELQMKIQDAQLSREQRAQAAAEQAQLRRDLVQMRIDADRSNREFAAAMRPPRADPLVQVEVPDPSAPGGKRAMYVPQSQAAGMSPPTSVTTGKQLPVNAAKALLDNNTNLRRAENALALIEGKEVDGIQGDPAATGKKGFLPDFMLQRMDESGIATRAAIADLGSLVIHDRSGAAVTAAEFPRLQPFIPSARDDPETVKKKLKNFVSVYRNLVNEQADFYEASGYNVPRSALKSSAGASVPAQSPANIPQIRNDADFARLPSGAEFIDPNGVRRRKP